MTFVEALAIVLTIEVIADMVAVAYVFRVYHESRRTTGGRLPMLYQLIAFQTAIKAVVGLVIGWVLVMFWSGQPVQGGAIVIGLSLVAMLLSPILVALVVYRIRRSGDEE